MKPSVALPYVLHNTQNVLYDFDGHGKVGGEEKIKSNLVTKSEFHKALTHLMSLEYGLRFDA